MKSWLNRRQQTSVRLDRQGVPLPPLPPPSIQGVLGRGVEWEVVLSRRLSDRVPSALLLATSREVALENLEVLIGDGESCPMLATS